MAHKLQVNRTNDIIFHNSSERIASLITNEEFSAVFIEYTHPQWTMNYYQA